MYKYLDKINCPHDLKLLSVEETLELSKEIRQFLIENVNKTGGHLASNLGIVEITLALYKIFSAPEDKIIFDVGHQSYVSKILTGRKNLFNTLRSENGISGFPKITESEYDAFGTGHSSTALSAALGIARANKLSGNDSYTIAVIGDGAFSGGLVYEALNNCENDLNLIVILNENEMSISPSVGNMAHLISGIRSKENYFKIKNAVQRTFEKVPFIGKPMITALKSVKKMLKNAIFNTNIVENFGFTYYGPIDGNDYLTVERLISQAKKHGGSAFIHMKTKKGKGYLPAEENPSCYHMVKPEGTIKTECTFSSFFGKIISEHGEENDRVCAISAAMTDGTGLSDFFKKYPSRAFDVGIAEGHAVTFAAGLSISGFIPIFAIYSSFLQRSYDNFLHDISLQKLHCILAIDRAGLSPDDGATHHGIFDVSMLSVVSDSHIYSPICYESMNCAFEEAISAHSGIYAIRYPKGCECTSGLVKSEKYVFTGSDFKNKGNVIITYGRIFSEALKAKTILENQGIECSVLVLEKLSPYSDTLQTILKYCGNADNIVILEEGMESGGFGQNIFLQINRCRIFNPKVSILAIQGEVPGHARLETLYKQCKISSDDIVTAVMGCAK